MRVCILGASLDVGNRGVLALARSVIGLVARTSPDPAVALHYSHREGGSRLVTTSGRTLAVEILNCRMSPSSEPAQHILVILLLALLYRLGIRGPARRNPWLRSLLAADFIGDITGGDSFSDIYGFRRFLQGSLPLVSAMVLGRPYTMLPQTYGPFRRPASRLIASLLLRQADTLLTRDKNCIATVQQLCGRAPEFCPDVAFTLEAAAPAVLHVSPGPFRSSVDDLVVGLNVSGLLYMGGYTGRNEFGLRASYRELVDSLIDRILSTTRASVLIVPHVFGEEEQEESASALVAETASRRHQGRVFVLQGSLSEQELKWVIGQTDFFAGSRMHACIAALSQCIPAVGLAYSDKFLGVFQSAGVGEAVVDLRGVTAEEVVQQTLSAIAKRDQLRAELRLRMPIIQQQIVDTFSGLMGRGRPGASLAATAGSALGRMH